MSQEELLSIRGLECRTHYQTLKKMETRALSRALVRDEQERQWNHGVQDPECLAMIYCIVSNQAQLEAMQQGRLDELAALMMY